MSEAVKEEYQEIEVIVDQDDSFGIAKELYDAPKNDPFMKDIGEIKTFNGLSGATKKKFSREIQKFQQGDTGVASKQIQPPGGAAYSIFDVVTPEYNLDYLAKLYEVSAPHMSAVQAKVANIVGLGFRWEESPKLSWQIDSIQQDGDDAKLRKIRSKVERLKNDLNNWIDTLNEEDEFVESLIKVWTDLETTGNGYLEIGRQDDGKIGYIGHIPSVSLRVRRVRDGFVQIIGKDVVFFRNFGDDKTADPVGKDPRPNEIIHLKKYSPSNSFYGIPDIVSAKNALAGNEFASRFNLDYFEHKAVPRHVIIVKGGKLSPQSEQRVINFFRTGLKGKHHRTLYIPITGENGADVTFEMKPVETGVQDASFVNYYKINRDEILMAHRVPITKIGVAEGATSLSIAKDADKTFKEQVCRPAQEIFEKKLNRIWAEVTDAFVMRLNELTLTDESEQANIDQINTRIGATTPNEIRARKGLPGLEGGDVPYVPPTGQAASETAAQTMQSRTRDDTRNANRSDSGPNGGRNPKGDGRKTQ